MINGDHNAERDTIIGRIRAATQTVLNTSTKKSRGYVITDLDEGSSALAEALAACLLFGVRESVQTQFLCALSTSICDPEAPVDSAELWVRHGMNHRRILDALSCLSNIERKALSEFFEPWALPLLNETVDVVSSLYKSLSGVSFNLTMTGHAACVVVSRKKKKRKRRVTCAVIDEEERFDDDYSTAKGVTRSSSTDLNKTQDSVTVAPVDTSNSLKPTQEPKQAAIPESGISNQQTVSVVGAEPQAEKPSVPIVETTPEKKPNAQPLQPQPEKEPVVPVPEPDVEKKSDPSVPTRGPEEKLLETPASQPEFEKESQPFVEPEPEPEHEPERIMEPSMPEPEKESEQLTPEPVLEESTETSVPEHQHETKPEPISDSKQEEPAHELMQEPALQSVAESEQPHTESVPEVVIPESASNSEPVETEENSIAPEPISKEEANVEPEAAKSSVEDEKTQVTTDKAEGFVVPSVDKPPEDSKPIPMESKSDVKDEEENASKEPGTNAEANVPPPSAPVESTDATKQKAVGVDPAVETKQENGPKKDDSVKETAASATVTTTTATTTTTVSDEEAKKAEEEREMKSKRRTMVVEKTFSGFLDGSFLISEYDQDDSKRTFSQIIEARLVHDDQTSSTTTTKATASTSSTNNIPEDVVFSRDPPPDWCPGLTEIHFYVPKQGSLEEQGNKCYQCAAPLSIAGSNRPRFCNYTGKFFCKKCFGMCKSMIFGRVVFDWDLQELPVNKTSAEFLKSIDDSPSMDFNALNPDIYAQMPLLEDLRIIRRKLYYLYEYIQCCTRLKPDDEVMRVKYRLPDYYFTSTELYSLHDVRRINELLDELISTAQVFGTHTSSCQMCLAKGFFCELCKRNEVIYPYQVQDTIQCPKCKGVFHRECFNATSVCPKCMRIVTRKLKASSHT